MTSIVKFTCLSGGQDHSPPCYLLQIDQFKCLLDCGWDEKYSPHIVEEISKHFKYLDAIFLSYPDPAHLGALPYLIKQHGALPCPVYTTRPVALMGQMFMTDALLSQLSCRDFDLFELSDIKNFFESDKIVYLNHWQTFHLEGRGDGLAIIPLPAGHMIGGTIWKIVKNNDETIVYAVDYNHRKERILKECALSEIKKPSLLITDAYNAKNTQIQTRSRDKKFLETIHSTLEKGGNVLIACDTAGRVLELAYILDHMWRDTKNGLAAYRLAMVSNVAVRTMEIAKTTLEFMSNEVQNDFSTSRDNPFDFKYLQLKQRLSELGGMPVVVLATPPDLECGFARELFALWNQQPDNTIIFTQRPSPGSLAYNVLSQTSGPVKVKFDISTRVELEGEELEEYRRKEEEKKKQLALTASKKALSNVDNIDEDSLSDDNLEVVERHFFKQARKAYLMFPGPLERRVRVDDYGEEIEPEKFVLSHKMDGSKVPELESDKENTGQNQIEDSIYEKIEQEIKPTKCLTITLDHEVQAKVCQFDFEGRSDGQSIEFLVSQVKPRRLILVRGTPESTQHMMKSCRKSVEDKDVGIFTPQTGEQVCATTESYIYQVKMKDSLISSLEFMSADEGVELAWVDVTAHITDDDENVDNEKLPYLDITEPEKITSHKSIFVNDFKLSNFKQVLLANGIQAEFSGGVLFCNDKVTVRRKDSDIIHIEGTLCDDYYKVRDLLYQQYVMI